MKVDFLREMISQEESKIKAKMEEELTRIKEETKMLNILYSEISGQEPTIMTRRVFDTCYLH